MRTANFYVITERDMAIFFDILYLLNGSILKGCRETSVINYRSIKMGPIGCSEMSVRNYCYRLRNNKNYRRSHLNSISFCYTFPCSMYGTYSIPLIGHDYCSLHFLRKFKSHR